MKVFTNNQFNGEWTDSTAAVVVAESAKEAADLLNVNLKLVGLHPNARSEDMIEVSLERESCRILCDGTY